MHGFLLSQILPLACPGPDSDLELTIFENAQCIFPLGYLPAGCKPMPGVLQSYTSSIHRASSTSLPLGIDHVAIFSKLVFICCF